MRTLALVAALLVTGAAVRADEVDDAAEAVQRAHAAKDEVALRERAARDEPDPWLVADALCARGRYDAADAFARAAHRKDVETLPAYVARVRAEGTNAAVARALATVTRALGEGQPEAALTALEEVDLSSDGVGAAEVLYARGHALRMTGRHGESADAFEASAGMAERLGWLARAGAAWNACSESAEYAGGLRRALACAERAFTAQEFRGSRADMVTQLNARGYLHHRLGDLAASFRCIEAGLALVDDGTRPRDRASLFLNLGVLHGMTGRMEEAAPCIQQALAIHEAAGNRRGMAQSLRDLGQVHGALQRYDEALTYYARSLETARAAGEAALAAHALMLMGDVHVERGRFDAARGCYDEARLLCERIGDHSSVAALLSSLATLLLHEGKHDEAMALLDETQRLAEEAGSTHRQLCTMMGRAKVDLARGEPRRAAGRVREAIPCVHALLGGLGEGGQAGVVEAVVGIYETGIRAAAALDDPAEMSFFLENARAAALLHSLGNTSELREAILPEELRLAEAAARKREAQAVAALRTASTGGQRAEIQSREGQLKEARRDVERVIDRIQREAKAAASLSFPQADGLDAIRERLHPTEALVYYALLDEDRRAPVSLALVVTRDEARIVPLAAPAEIEAACRALVPDDTQVSPAEAVAKLRTMVLDPLRLQAKTGRLLVCPDKALTYIPFALLDTQREIVHVPSGTVVGLLKREPAERGRRVLALGDPEYGGALPALPATRREVEAVGDVRLLGKEATPASLRAAVAGEKRWRSVHLACHGQVDTNHPLLTSLALAPEGDHDGRIRAMDILRMEVRADLVVLSACATARGRVFKGEGLVGFPRAFMFAGAPRVIVSLWNVDDEATQALMKRFYELWKPGKASTADALRRAQESLRTGEDGKWRHPYYWAAWQLWGLPD